MNKNTQIAIVVGAAVVVGMVALFVWRESQRKAQTDISLEQGLALIAAIYGA